MDLQTSETYPIQVTMYLSHSPVHNYVQYLIHSSVYKALQLSGLERVFLYILSFNHIHASREKDTHVIAISLGYSGRE
jgi:hypothetical protein